MPIEAACYPAAKDECKVRFGRSHETPAVRDEIQGVFRQATAGASITLLFNQAKDKEQFVRLPR